MNLSFYETIELHEDFPLIFHEDMIEPHFVLDYPHWHEHIELLYFRSGKGWVYIDTEPYRVVPGSLIIVPSSALHMFESEDETLLYDCLIVDWNYFRKCGFDATENGVPPKLEDAEVGQLFSLLRREMAGKEKQYQNAAQGLTQYLLSLIYRRYGLEKAQSAGHCRSGKFDTVKAVMQYLKAHLSETVRIEDVAAEFGFSKYYFCRLFKEVTGLNAVSYLNRARCVEARRLLRMTDDTIADISTQCGFDSPAYFSKTYQKFMGVRPREERQKEV